MQINKLSTPAFGTQNYNKQTTTNKTLTIPRNTLIAGLAGLLASCTSDTFTLSTGPNGEPMIPLTHIMPGATSKEKRDVVAVLDEQNPSVISDVANEVCLIRHFEPTDNSNGYYSRPTETLNINDISFLHELAHAIDSYDNNGTTSQHFSYRPEYIRTFNQEMANFLQSDLYFRNNVGAAIIIDSPQEIFAECGAYVISDGEYDTNEEIFEEYFPKTMALTRQYINEARSLPKNRRMSYSVKAQNLADGTRKYTFVDGRGQKRVEETFDLSLWPYRYAPKTVTYDANCNKVKEVSVKFNNNQPSEKSTWTASQGVKNEKIMTEATRQAYGLVEILRAAEKAQQNNQN